MPRIANALAAALTLTAFVAASPAAAANIGWSLRAGGVATDYNRHRAYSYFDYSSHLELDGGSGPTVAAELRLHRRFGLELSASRIGLDAHSWTVQRVPISFNPLIFEEQTTLDSRGSLTLEPLALSALFHLFPDRVVDVYFGPQVGRVSFDVDMPYLGEREPELAYGGKAGLEVRFGDGPWAAAAEVGRLEVEHEYTGDRSVFGHMSVSTASVLVVFRGR